MQIANLLKKLTKSKSKLILSEFLKKNEIIKTRANIKKVRKFFGWKPKTNLNNGLRKYLIKLKNENSSSNN